VRLLGALAALGAGMAFAHGWTVWLLPPGRRAALVAALTTLGLSLGALTLVMFWIAVLLPGRLGLWPIVTACGVVGAAGWRLAAARSRAGPPAADPPGDRPDGPLAAVLWAVVGLVSAGILVNAAAWPFADEDALAIYAPLGRLLYGTGALPARPESYDAYPMLVPLGYAFTHWAYGQVNEYLARLVPAAMAVGAIGAAGALGYEIRSAAVGLGAAGLVALTPVFARWASSGYTDVPAAFFVALSALHAWRWWRSGDDRDGVLTGLGGGLAMWTKNSAVTLPATLAALVALRWLAGRRGGGAGPLRWRAVWLGAAALVATAGPWYARNLLLFGFLIPPGAAWTHQAPRDLAAALVLARGEPQQFWMPGWLFTGAIAAGIWRLVREGPGRAAPWAALLAFVLPFGIAWWALVSYDARLLMPIVPLLAVMGALLLDDLARWARLRLPPAWAARLPWAAALVVLALAPFSLRKAVEHKAVLLTHPALGDVERHRLRLGGLYEIARAVSALPPGSRVVGLPARARYHVEGDRLHVSDAPASRLPLGQLEEYDYVVLRPDARERPGWLQDRRQILRTGDGYALYAVRGGP
jgi:hypothetical protein